MRPYRILPGLLLAGLSMAPLFAQNKNSQVDWNKPFPPHKVIANIYFVGTDQLGSFLITTPEGHILINSDFEATVGGGVEGRVSPVGADERTSYVLVGSARLLDEHGIDIGPLAGQARDAAQGGRTLAFVAIDGRAAGILAINDPLKPGSASAVSEIQRAGIEVWLVTGDARSTAAALAGQVGIADDHVIASASPEDKSKLVERLQASGHRVAVVGDGINDAPALARADVGIAIGTGADVAVEASDVTLVGGDPRGVATAIELSRSTMGIVRQNLFWAFAYNVLLIPVAMGVLYPSLGVTLSPALAAGAMALSSVAVVANSLRLRTFDGRPTASRSRAMPRLVMRLREAWFLGAIAIASLVFAGGVMAADRAIDAGAEHHAVIARGTAFTPPDLRIRAGDIVVVTFTNGDTVFHDWQVLGLANVDAGARPGQVQRIRFRVDTPGRYRIVCSVEGHAAAGMTGTLTVEPPD